MACSQEGEVFTWGDNDEGQLGDGTTTAIQRPRLVAALSVRAACGELPAGDGGGRWSAVVC